VKTKLDVFGKEIDLTSSRVRVIVESNIGQIVGRLELDLSWNDVPKKIDFRKPPVSITVGGRRVEFPEVTNAHVSCRDLLPFLGDALGDTYADAFIYAFASYHGSAHQITLETNDLVKTQASIDRLRAAQDIYRENRRGVVKAWHALSVILSDVAQKHEHHVECGHEDCRVDTQMSLECYRSRGGAWMSEKLLQKRGP